jgi:hypothetical protein
MDLIFSNAGADITVGTCEFPLLKLACHYKAYELSVDVQFCKFKAMEATVKRFRFAAADREANIFFSRVSAGRCDDLFYDVVMLSCFESFVIFTESVSKFSRVTKELNDSFGIGISREFVSFRKIY